MKRITLTICAAAFLLASCKDENKTEEPIKADATVSSTEDSKPKEEPWVAVDDSTGMKNWMAYATPGETHKMLAKSNGTWKGEMTMWMAADAPPSTATAIMVNKMIMGGRYQVSETKGNMMGMPFEGKGLMGYDNIRKIFQSTWVDNMSTGVMYMEGPYDRKTNSIIL